jgi:hypothetical protein
MMIIEVKLITGMTVVIIAAGIIVIGEAVG